MDNREKLIELGKGKLFEAELLHGLFTSGNLYGFETFDDFCKAPIINGAIIVITSISRFFNNSLSLIKELISLNFNLKNLATIRNNLFFT